MRIIVTGSLAYDYIMDFPGLFKDHILPEKTHMLTVSFLVDSLKRLKGGVAGNVAYGLALLGERPLVVSAAGMDFHDYGRFMREAGVDTAGIRQIDGEFTASCFINTDKSNNQIVAFYPGAVAHSREMSLEGLKLTSQDWVVISPTDPGAMVRHAAECKKMGAKYIFDPGKQTPRLERDQILAGLDGATALVGNDYEFAMMAKATGLTEEKLIASAPLAVVTKGAEGATIYDQVKKTRTDVPVAPVDNVVDPTGAGDAFLSGLTFGFSRNLPHELTGRIGALAAAYAIEKRGCQEHHFTRADFVARYQRCFGDASALSRLFA